MEVQQEQTTQNTQISDKYTNFFDLKTTFKTQYQDLPNGERLGFRESGQGENLIMLHGNFTCSTVYESLMTKLSKYMKCIAPCMRGFGYSSYNTPINSLKDLAEDIKLFAKERKMEKFYLCGHQLGGCVALEVAALIPESVQGIINFSMFPLKGLKVPGYDINTLEDIKSLPEYRGFHSMMQNMDLQYYKEGFSQLVNVNGIVDEYARKQLTIMNRQRNFWQVCLGVHNFDFEQQIKELQMPIKLIYGMQDKVCPMEGGLEYKEQFTALDKVKVVGFPNAKHFPIEENEKSSIEHIVSFMGQGKVMMNSAQA